MSSGFCWIQLIRKARMSSKSFGYDIESVARYYVKYRPTYPAELYENILKYVDEDSSGVKRRGLAVDIGCGSGQSTWHLAKSFDTVVGVDNSEAQLKQGKIATAHYRNITYRIGSAENLSAMFDEGSVDLITVGTALHWFDIDKFYKECLKILKVGGTFAAYGNFVLIFHNAEATDVLHKVYFEATNAYYAARVNHAYDLYRELFGDMPNYFRKCTRDDSIFYHTVYSLEDLNGFFKTHPPYYLYKADHPEEQPDIFNAAIEKLQDIYGTKSMKDKVARTTNPIPLIMGKK